MSKQIPIHVISNTSKVVLNVLHRDVVKCRWNIFRQSSNGIVTVGPCVTFCLGPATLNRVHFTMVFRDEKKGMATAVDIVFQLGFLIHEVWMRSDLFAHVFQFHFAVVTNSLLILQSVPLQSFVDAHVQ